MKVLIVVAHYREKSLTYELKNHLQKGLQDAGHEADILDLYKLKFNPILEYQDDYFWPGHNGEYSEEVVREQERLLKYDAVIFIFPIYWLNMPAMLKGYVDRVFNHGFAYGKTKTWYPKKLVWMPLVGATEENFESRKIAPMVDFYFHLVSNFMEIKSTRVKMFYQTATENSEEINQKLIKEAYNEGLNFEKW